MPSKLLTHTAGGMAAPMEISEAEGGQGNKSVGAGSTSALSVSRSSVKINKNMRRAMTQPRPAPQVYKTEPAEFRSLVQRLTGSSPPAESSAILTPKPLNPRLQKIAPPPLRPVFHYPGVQQALPQQQPQQQSTGFNPGPRRSFLSSVSSMAFQSQQRQSNFPVSPLSFSPLPALSPSDQIWANVLNPQESPRAAAMRHLAQTMGGSASLPPAAQNANQDFSRFSGPPSPRMSAPFNAMPSEHFGLGNMFGYGGPLSPTPSSLSMEDSFSFPDPDVPRSRFS